MQLALVGWYLMLAPINSQLPDGVDTDAPLLHWFRAGAAPLRLPPHFTPHVPERRPDLIAHYRIRDVEPCSRLASRPNDNKAAGSGRLTQGS